MLLDKDAILRYGGCFAIALAYVGTLSLRRLVLRSEPPEFP